MTTRKHPRRAQHQEPEHSIQVSQDPPGEDIPKVPLTQEEAMALLIRSAALQRVIAILANGKRAVHTPHAFPAHDELFQRMLRAYNAREKGEQSEDSSIDDFLLALRLYLERIPLFTPQSGRVEDAAHLVDRIERLMSLPGLGPGPVECKILGVLYALV